MLWLDYERTGDELAVVDVDAVEGVDILIQEGAVLSYGPAPLGYHFWYPHILPVGDAMTLDILEEDPDVHEQIDVVWILYFVELGCRHQEQLELRVLSRDDVHLSVVQRRLYSVKLMGSYCCHPEVVYLVHGLAVV